MRTAEQNYVKHWNVVCGAIEYKCLLLSAHLQLDYQLDWDTKIKKKYTADLIKEIRHCCGFWDETTENI